MSVNRIPCQGNPDPGRFGVRVVRVRGSKCSFPGSIPIPNVNPIPMILGGFWVDAILRREPYPALLKNMSMDIASVKPAERWIIIGNTY